MILKPMLDATGIMRTYNPFEDDYNFFVSLRIPGIENLRLEQVIVEADKLRHQPFLRFFYYGTNIGETLEEVIGKKFSGIIPKLVQEKKKNGKGYKKGLKPNPIYQEYYKKHNMKSTNFDWLFYGTDSNIYRLEVKVIRAADSKDKTLTSEKLYQTQAPLVERALTFSQGSGGNGTFQQTKPEFFDYVMGVVMYADQVDFYLVPSSHINCEENIKEAVEVDESTGKKKKGIGGHLILKPQHGKAQKNPNGTYKEGHLVLNQLNNSDDGYKILSVYSEEELLAPASLNLSKYIK